VNVRYLVPLLGLAAVITAGSWFVPRSESAGTRVEWDPSPEATHYVVVVVPSGGRVSDAHPFLSLEIQAPATRAALDLPPGRWRIGVKACSRYVCSEFATTEATIPRK
jgi:hypothetical protein